MKIFYLGILILVFSCGQKPIGFNYDAVCAGVGTFGTSLVKISTYGKSLEKAKAKFKSYAVHAVLFKGIGGSGVAGTTCQEKKPICNVSYTEKQEWFDIFFNSGDYLKYVSFTNEGYISSNDRVKMANGNYKVSTTVSIAVNELRKRMEKEGFARSLSQGF